MLILQFTVAWCLVFSGAFAGNNKREIPSPEIVRGGFAASSGPYGNEASASTLNYQAGNQGNYNNVDYGSYNGQNSQQLNIPVNEQSDLSPQQVRVPVWSPPVPSQNPYAPPQQFQASGIPQSGYVQVPIQHALQVPYQADPQIQQQIQVVPQQPGYPEQGLQSIGNNFPQQYSHPSQPDQGPSFSPPSQANLNVPIFLGVGSSVHGAPSSYNGIPPPSSASSIAASYGPTVQTGSSSIPPSFSRGVNSFGKPSPSFSNGVPSFPSGIPSISSGIPSRLRGKSLSSGPPSVSGLTVDGGVGDLHSLEDILSGGLGGFDTSSFGNGFGSGGFGFGGFGKNYFGGLGGFNGFNSFGGSPFQSSFTFGGLKGGIGGGIPKVSAANAISNAASNGIPSDNKVFNDGNIPTGPTGPTDQNAPLPNTSAINNIPPNAINQPAQGQSVRH